MNEKTLKILGFATTIISIGAAALSAWVNDKKMEKIIEDKVNEKINESMDQEQ